MSFHNPTNPQTRTDSRVPGVEATRPKLAALTLDTVPENAPERSGTTADATANAPTTAVDGHFTAPAWDRSTERISSPTTPAPAFSFWHPSAGDPHLQAGYMPLAAYPLEGPSLPPRPAEPPLRQESPESSPESAPPLRSTTAFAPEDPSRRHARQASVPEPLSADHLTTPGDHERLATLQDEARQLQLLESQAETQSSLVLSPLSDGVVMAPAGGAKARRTVKWRGEDMVVAEPLAERLHPDDEEEGGGAEGHAGAGLSAGRLWEAAVAVVAAHGSRSAVATGSRQEERVDGRRESVITNPWELEDTEARRGESGFTSLWGLPIIWEDRASDGSPQASSQALPESEARILERGGSPGSPGPPIAPVAFGDQMELVERVLASYSLSSRHDGSSDSHDERRAPTQQTPELVDPVSLPACRPLTRLELRSYTDGQDLMHKYHPVTAKEIQKMVRARCNDPAPIPVLAKQIHSAARAADWLHQTDLSSLLLFPQDVLDRSRRSSMVDRTSHQAIYQSVDPLMLPEPAVRRDPYHELEIQQERITNAQLRGLSLEETSTSWPSSLVPPIEVMAARGPNPEYLYAFEPSSEELEETEAPPAYDADVQPPEYLGYVVEEQPDFRSTVSSPGLGNPYLDYSPRTSKSWP